MMDYKYTVDTHVINGNVSTLVSFGFNSVSDALKCFNDSIETRRRSHTYGQVWTVTLYNTELCDICGRISSIDFSLE